MIINLKNPEENQAAVFGLRKRPCGSSRQAKDEVLQEQTKLEEAFESANWGKNTLGGRAEPPQPGRKGAQTKTDRTRELKKRPRTARLQARTEALHSLQRRYEMILNSAGEGICGLDVDGKATFVNPTVAKLTGWPIDELVGKTEQEIFVSNGQKTNDLSPDERVLYRKGRDPVSRLNLVKTPINEKRSRRRIRRRL